MSIKTKSTVYCDEANCQVNQTFIVIGRFGTHTVDQRGVARSLLDVLKGMDWKVMVGVPITGQIEQGRRVLTLCPKHADPRKDPQSPSNLVVVD